MITNLFKKPISALMFYGSLVSLGIALLLIAVSSALGRAFEACAASASNGEGAHGPARLTPCNAHNAALLQVLGERRARRLREPRAGGERRGDAENERARGAERGAEARRRGGRRRGRRRPAEKKLNAAQTSTISEARGLGVRIKAT